MEDKRTPKRTLFVAMFDTRRKGRFRPLDVEKDLSVLEIRALWREDWCNVVRVVNSLPRLSN